MKFSKEKSPENAFFIIPEDTHNLKNALLIHVRVALLKQYLHEVKLFISARPKSVLTKLPAASKI